MKKIVRIEPLDIFVIVGDSRSSVTIRAEKVIYEGGKDYDYSISKTYISKKSRYKNKSLSPASRDIYS